MGAASDEIAGLPVPAPDCPRERRDRETVSPGNPRFRTWDVRIGRDDRRVSGLHGPNSEGGADLAEVVLFHHACGRMPGVVVFADELRRAGHTVRFPDLYDGRTFRDLDAGVGYAQQLGFETIIERGARIAEGLPAGLVYGGFSLGVLPAQTLAQTRPGASGAQLICWCVASDELGAPWPDGVPVQVHGMDEDEIFAEEETARPSAPSWRVSRTGRYSSTRAIGTCSPTTVCRPTTRRQPACSSRGWSASWTESRNRWRPPCRVSSDPDHSTNAAPCHAEQSSPGITSTATMHGSTGTSVDNRVRAGCAGIPRKLRMTQLREAWSQRRPASNGLSELPKRRGNADSPLSRSGRCRRRPRPRLRHGADGDALGHRATSTPAETRLVSVAGDAGAPQRPPRAEIPVGGQNHRAARAGVQGAGGSGLRPATHRRWTAEGAITKPGAPR